MARVYILDNVSIPSSADLNGNYNASHLVVPAGFNSSNCLSTVTYYVTVDGVSYGNFTLTADTVGWILDGLYYGSEYEGARLPEIGNLCLASYDWDAQGGDPGWRWTGRTGALVSIYYLKEENYFNNSELNTLWNRLVNATKSICGETLKSWRVRANTEVDPDCYPYIEGDYLCSSGDPWEMEEVDTGEIWSFYPDNPLSLVGLSTTGNYHIYSTVGGIGDYSLIYTVQDNLTGIKPIHDALIKHFNLIRSTTPTTAGDYMKGIAVAARYKQQGYINPNPSELWSLEQIVEAFEEKYTLILYENGDWTLVPSAYDGNIFLYDADTEESWFVAGAATISSGNVSEYMQQGHRYYLAGEVQESQDKSHLVRSNTVEALVTPNFDIMVSVEPTGDSYEVSVDVLDPGYSPTPDTITIEIYDETDMTDFVGSQTWHNTNSVTADVREIASQLHQDSWYRVVATAKKTGFNDASAESYFTWSYGETEGEFTISAHIDETTVVISVSAFDNVIYGYSFILYDEYGNYISDTYRDAPGEFEYYPSLDSLFGTGLYEGSAYGLQITADGADGKTATTYITFTYGVSK